MDVNEIYELMKYIINKNMQGNLPPAKFRLVINQGQRSYISYLLGSFQQYTPGRPVSRVELGSNSVVRQRLAPVIYGYILNIDPYGNSPYPGDYIQTDAMWGIYGPSIYGGSIYGTKRIRFVQQTQLDSYYNSVIDPPPSNPIYLIQDVNFQFYPTNLYQAKLHYVRDAPEIIWGYTLDVNNRPIYDPTTSQQPVWDTAAIFDVIIRALQMVGINLQANQVIAYSNEIKTQGQ